MWHPRSDCQRLTSDAQIKKDKWRTKFENIFGVMFLNFNHYETDLTFSTGFWLLCNFLGFCISCPKYLRFLVLIIWYFYEFSDFLYNYIDVYVTFTTYHIYMLNYDNRNTLSFFYFMLTLATLNFVYLTMVHCYDICLNSL